jgi:hypothetical protein
LLYTCEHKHKYNDKCKHKRLHKRSSKHEYNDSMVHMRTSNIQNMDYQSTSIAHLTRMLSCGILSVVRYDKVYRLSDEGLPAGDIVVHDIPMDNLYPCSVNLTCRMTCDRIGLLVTVD